MPSFGSVPVSTISTLPKLGHVTQGGCDRLAVHCGGAGRFHAQRHGVSFAVALHDQTSPGDFGMTSGDLRDLLRVHKHALDLGALIGPSIQPLMR